MTGFMHFYIRIIDAINYRVGRVIMYGIFAHNGHIYLWSSVKQDVLQYQLSGRSKWHNSPNGSLLYPWSGPYSIQLGSNVRMDLLYGEWSTP